MIPLDYALALALLTIPADAADAPPAVDALTTLRPTLQGIAIYWEILDPREVRYVLTRGEDYAADVKLLRRRCHDLADAPPLHDCMRFPDRALINELLAFNRAYRQHLDSRQSLEL